MWRCSDWSACGLCGRLDACLRTTAACGGVGRPGCRARASLSVVSGLAVGTVPRSWQCAHDWVLLSGITAGLVLAAVAVAVLQARSPGRGERPGGPLVRVGTIRARTVQIAAAEQAVPGLGSWPTTATAAGQPLDEVTDPFALGVYRPVQPEDPPSGAADGGHYQR